MHVPCASVSPTEYRFVSLFKAIPRECICFVKVVWFVQPSIFRPIGVFIISVMMQQYSIRANILNKNIKAIIF